MPDENVIDETVVLVSPDLSKFREKLRAKLDKASKGVTVKVPVTFDVDGRELGRSLKAAVAKHQPVAKVRLQADATGWAASVRTALAGKNTPEAKVRLVADARGLNTSISKALRQADAVKRVEQSHTQAVVGETRKREAAEDEYTRVVQRATRERARARKTESALMKASRADGLVDFGGSGIRPGNLAVAALVALSPALISVASSATLASSSVAALGAAAIGTAGALTAIVVGTSGLRQALTLRETTRKEEQRAQTLAKAAGRDQTSHLARLRALAAAQRSLRDALRGVADAQRDIRYADRDAAVARRGISEAYTEAARKVRDLREAISDLAREEQQGSIDVAAARENLRQVNNNYWATDIERRQAALDVQKALDRRSDATRERLDKTAELNKRLAKGPAGAPEVVNAKEKSRLADQRAADARRALQTATERVTDAQIALTTAKVKDTVATTAASTAAQDLAAQIAALSPAARDLYYWIDANRPLLDSFRHKMEQAVSPGFLTFLQQITDRGRRKPRKSTLDLLADGAARLGKIVTRTIGDLGVLANSKWFRRDVTEVNAVNAKSFTLLGDAAKTLLRPLATITRVSAPLFTRFAGWIDTIAEKFAGFIDRSEKNGSLVRWFKDAGDEMAKWGAIARNLLTFLKDVFTASLPSGKDLVTRIKDATAQLAAWSSSTDGQARMRQFFEWFKTLDYARIGQFVKNFGLLIAGLKAFTFARNHPFYLLMTLLAAQFPSETGALLNTVATAMGNIMRWVIDHPGQAAVVLGILTAARYAKSVNVGLKVLGLDSLAESLFGKLFGKSVGVMTVHAATVNVVGGVPGVGGLPTPVPTGPFALPNGAATLPLYGVGAVPNQDPNPEKFKPVTPDQKAEQRAKYGTGFEGIWRSLFGVERPGWRPGGSGTFGPSYQGIDPMRQADANHGVPEMLRPTTQSAYTVPYPNAFSKSTEPIGQSMVRGMQDGYAAEAPNFIKQQETLGNDAVNKLRDTLGVHSPSTVTYVVGEELINGLENGFRDRWTARIEAIKTWITENIGAPLSAAFSAVGTAIRTAFVTPFNTLTSNLAGPVTAALKWIDVNIIDKINSVLSSLGVSTLPRINAGASLGDTVGRSIGGAIGNVGKLLQRADGGPVPGVSAHSKADNIPAMLTANEYVQPVDTVKHYGVGFMDRLRRKEIPADYADGGLVGSMTKAFGGPNLLSRLGEGALKQLGGNTIADIAKNLASRLFTVGSGGGTARGDLGVARLAEATARAMGASDKQLLALIEAGIVESGLRNLNYGDRDSLGFLQQRPSQGWGSRNQIMDVAYATRSFIRRAKTADKSGQTAGQLAQAVQRSAFPDRYDQAEADAIATINREAPGIGSYGVPVGGFPPWPSSPAAQRGDTGVWRKIVALARSSGLPVHPTSLYRPGDPKWHGSGRAVDFGGYNQDALAQFFMARKPSVLELIHRTNTRDYGVRRGRDHNMGEQWPLHRNHLHVAMNQGGLVPMRRYDNGGGLAPGVTLAVNGTGQTETVRTAQQEKTLNAGSNRLDIRDLQLLAQYITAASARPINVDGRRLAEIVHSYGYLPGGV